MQPYIVAGLGVGALLAAFVAWQPVVPVAQLTWVSEQEEQIEQKATILFGGDAFFDRSVRTTMEEKGAQYVFSCIAPLLKAADLTVLNLEGPITDNASVSVGSEVGSPNNFRFTFHPDVAPLLVENNVRVVNLGNNHILNFGYDGVGQTTRYLDAAGVAYFGEPDAYTVTKMVVNEIPLAFIGYNEFGGSAPKTLEQIKVAVEEGYLPVVYAHWGIEYETISSLPAQQLARMFVDAGAKLVIGSHPHVIQQSELYNGVHIYYSLGNFIFDQYWNDEVRTGLLVEATFDKSGVLSVEEVRTYLERDRRTCPLPEPLVN